MHLSLLAPPAASRAARAANALLAGALLLALGLAAPVQATDYVFDVLYFGGNVATLDSESDDPTTTSLLPGDNFVWTMTAQENAAWLVETGGSFFTLMAFPVDPEGTRTIDFVLRLLHNGEDVFFFSESEVTNQEVHLGTNGVPLATGLLFDEMRLELSLLDAVELAASASDPDNLQTIETVPTRPLARVRRPREQSLCPRHRLRSRTHQHPAGPAEQPRLAHLPPTPLTTAPPHRPQQRRGVSPPRRFSVDADGNENVGRNKPCASGNPRCHCFHRRRARESAEGNPTWVAPTVGPTGVVTLSPQRPIVGGAAQEVNPVGEKQTAHGSLIFIRRRPEQAVRSSGNDAVNVFTAAAPEQRYRSFRPTSCSSWSTTSSPSPAAGWAGVKVFLATREQQNVGPLARPSAACHSPART